MTLTVSPGVVTYPAIITLRAMVSTVGTAVATFEVRFESDPVWYGLGSVTSTTGRFVFLHVPPKKAYYRVIVGDVVSTSLPTVLVHARMSKPVSNTTRVRAGTQLRLSGTIRPQHPTGTPPPDVLYRVYFEKYNPTTHRWRAYTSVPWHIKAVLDNDTSLWAYNRTFWASQVGSWRVRFYHSCPRHASAYSPALYFTVVSRDQAVRKSGCRFDS